MNEQNDTPLLVVRNLRVGYGDIEVIKDISLIVRDRQTLAVIGPNGAGKTTLFKAMTGEIRCRAGAIHYNGADITTTPAYFRTRLGFGRTFQVSRVFLGFTALDNVVVAIESRRRNNGDHLGAPMAMRPSADVLSEGYALLEMLGLHDLRNQSAAALAHGDKKRLELAVALALKPRILMLDEPTAGMATPDRIKIVELIQRLREQLGITIVMTEHDMDVIFNLADQIMVMNYGELVAKGSVDEVRRNQTVRDIYLGQEIYDAAN